ncbi:MAG: shikimate dehydrogenase, partial [Candidatus Atribacteria bacterium]|nr:shikimate dehydrogenase [Candidatus Atribacteria bacterium]
MESNSPILGLLGEHIENSPSPLIQKHFIHYYSLNYSYFPFQITPDNLREAIMGVRALGIQGLNITLSFKERSIAFMDYIDSSAKK